jgi:hypothetical protein
MKIAKRVKLRADRKLKKTPEYEFRPVRFINGKPWSGRGISYIAPNTDAIFIGEPIKLRERNDSLDT